jgi:exopolysaccharide biosynthesis polyprenyl glycosylphosphotransferase
MARARHDGRITSTTVRVGGLVLADACAVSGAFLGAFQLRGLEAPPVESISAESFAWLTLALLPAWIAAFAACGLYSTRRAHGRGGEAGRVVLAVLLAVVMLIVADHVTLGLPLFPGGTAPLAALALGVLATLAARRLVRAALATGPAAARLARNTVVVGSGPLAAHIAGAMAQPGAGSRVVAAVSASTDGALLLGSIPVYPTLEQVLDNADLAVHEVVHADPDASRDDVARSVALATGRGLGYRYVPDLSGIGVASTVSSTVAGMPVVELRLTRLDGGAAVLKRVVDAVGAAVGLVLLAPLFAVIALAVKLSDPEGPVLYRQERLGRGGRRIGIYKFRSMLWAYSTGPDRPYQTATEAFEAMGRSDLVAEFLVQQKVADDPRVSRLGRFLRRTSLDELPQLVNALLGHISLVGPRPITAGELERYGDHRARFLALKPGITGLWQVSGRSAVGYDERVQLDVHYGENWSAWLDLSILAKTVVTVSSRRGAC